MKIIHFLDGYSRRQLDDCPTASIEKPDNFRLFDRILHDRKHPFLLSHGILLIAAYSFSEAYRVILTEALKRPAF